MVQTSLNAAYPDNGNALLRPSLSTRYGDIFGISTRLRICFFPSSAEENSNARPLIGTASFFLDRPAFLSLQE